LIRLVLKLILGVIEQYGVVCTGARSGSVDNSQVELEDDDEGGGGSGVEEARPLRTSLRRSLIRAKRAA
jgi:hypothetical protein